MLFIDKFDALGRIIIAIRAYRRQSLDHREKGSSDSMNAYLKKHLCPHDWMIWQFLKEANEQANSDSVQELPPLSAGQFIFKLNLN